MTVGDAGTLRHPRFLRTVTTEFRQVTEDCSTVDWCHGTRHGDVLTGEPREPGLLFSSRSRLMHTAVYPGMSCLGRGWDSDTSAKDHLMFCKCYFALIRDSLDVAAPGDCSSAINPKVQHRPMFLPAIPVSSRADRILGIDGRQASGGTAPLTGSR